ncbi:hypothetical protein [Gelidibacter maritimus]|uniref:Outer membrane beta-barrel protein n=1 Tax=Gelidibacter maritimus TaxID=2761487 RepID=A0A7W2M666_9FLAO|nr:hypothetical protein [Gelidibacter maritimus]MBA6153435.1 hypothetical protein [Gelidibacter maritimus]
MKKILICLFISVIGVTANAQRFYSFEQNWKASVGLNTVGSLNTENPFKRLGDYAFRFPLAVAIEHQWDKEFAAEFDISLNGYKTGDPINNGTAPENLTYFSTNANFKWYFTDYLFDSPRIDLFLSGGLGLLYVDDLTSTINIGPGIQYWFNQDVGIRFQSTSKFALDKKLYANNHFQHSLMMMFRL